MDRVQKISQLSDLSIPQIKLLAVALDAPTPTGQKEEQLAALVEWAESLPGPGFDSIVAAVDRLFGPAGGESAPVDDQLLDDQTAPANADPDTNTQLKTRELQQARSSLERGLAACSRETLESLATKLDYGPFEEISTASLARWLVDECSVDDALPKMLSLASKLDKKESHLLDDVVDRMLPLTYDRSLIATLHTSFQNQPMKLVPCPVGNPTIAEIIMAGYDAKPIAFNVETLHGAAAFECELGPEVGAKEERTNADQSLLDFLLHMIASVDTTFVGRRAVLAASNLEGLVTALKGRLLAYSSYLERTLYCLVRVPQSTAERDLWFQVLTRVSQEIDKIVFVERVDATNQREEQFAAYIAIRHSGR